MNTRQQLEQQRRFPQERRPMHPPIPQATRQPAPVQLQPPQPVQLQAPQPQRVGPPPPIATQVRVEAPAPNNNNNNDSDSDGGEDNAPKRGGRKPKEEVAEPIGAAQAGLSEEQRSAIQRYIQLDDEINTLNAAVKEKRAERSELEDDLIGILRPLPAPIRAGRTILRTKKKLTKEGINQKFWTTKLASSGHLKDPSKADQLVKSIYKNRTSTEDYELVRENIAAAASQE